MACTRLPLSFDGLINILYLDLYLGVCVNLFVLIYLLGVILLAVAE